VTVALLAELFFVCGLVNGRLPHVSSDHIQAQSTDTLTREINTCSFITDGKIKINKIEQKQEKVKKKSGR